MKLRNKIVIKGKIITLTGLHIGGNKSSMEIGGIDLGVIKTGNGYPYIPGSSLKGKLSSLLAKVRGSQEKRTDSALMKLLFGDAGGKEAASSTRIQVRDAHLDLDHFNSEAGFGGKDSRFLDFEFSEIKTENRIDRVTGTAKDPRQVERVPAGATFNFEIVVDIYEEDPAKDLLKLLDEALQLLEMDYLGGHGSRGSGQVSISKLNITGKELTEHGINRMNGDLWQGLFTEFEAA